MRKKRKKKQMRKRRWFTASELVEVWNHWDRGESTKEIGRILDRGGSTIHRQLAVYGGIRPRERCRSPRALTLAEREEISRGIAAKQSIRSIAAGLGRASSTVGREISRNGGYDKYRALEADAQAWERARRPKSCRLAETLISGRRVASRVTRNDLSQSFHPGPRGFEERSDRVSADETHDSPIRKSEPERPWKGTDRRHGLDP